MPARPATLPLAIIKNNCLYGLAIRGITQLTVFGVHRIEQLLKKPTGIVALVEMRPLVSGESTGVPGVIQVEDFRRLDHG